MKKSTIVWVAGSLVAFGWVIAVVAHKPVPSAKPLFQTSLSLYSHSNTFTADTDLPIGTTGKVEYKSEGDGNSGVVKFEVTDNGLTLPDSIVSDKADLPQGTYDVDYTVDGGQYADVKITGIVVDTNNTNDNSNNGESVNDVLANRAADGNVWTTLNEQQKEMAVTDALDTLRLTYNVTASNQFFIDALNAMYGTPQTNSVDILDACKMAGLMGNTLVAKN